MLPVSVVVPVRNTEGTVEKCLQSIRLQGVDELIVVDGLSSDNTVEIARHYADEILSDGGRGLPTARTMGVQVATNDIVALVDADVVMPPNALASLLDEFSREEYAGLQAGLESTSGPGYWGQALVEHHRTGRSKRWFGLGATLFRKETLLEIGFDDRFISGEDIELRWRLQSQGLKVGISNTTTVEHRFIGDDFAFAREQFEMDGRGLGLMIKKHPKRALYLLALPGMAALRGILLTTLRLRLRWVPYYIVFALFNYRAMISSVLNSGQDAA